MSRFIFTEEPPRHWHELCRQQNDMFNSPQWHAVLQKGFGCKVLYGWDETTFTGLTIAVFKAGVFRVGYLGFPVGGTLDSVNVGPGIIEAIRNAVLPETIHLVRIPESAFAKNEDIPLPFVITLETAIDELQEWEPGRLSRNMKKSIGKAVRSPLKIEYASEPSCGGIMYKLYRNTVLRHKGNLRYTEVYFRSLIELSKINRALRCFLVMKDNNVAGFLAVALHHETAYDLHCCIDEEFHKNSSDFLTYNAIFWAKEQGMKRYNLMSSPLNRMSLVSYKEKWGGETRRQKRYELALRPLHTMVFKTASLFYEGTSKLIKRK